MVLLKIEEGIFEVKATTGDTHHGGEEFDNHLVNSSSRSSSTRAFLPMLMPFVVCVRERAKCTLSSATQTSIKFDSLYEGINLYMSLLAPSLRCSARSSSEAPSSLSKWSFVIPRSIPRIVKLVSDFFNGKEPNKSIDHDEAVIYGGTVQAAFLSVDTSETTQDLLLLDIVPLSLSIKTAGGVMTTLIKRNTTKKSEILSTY